MQPFPIQNLAINLKTIPEIDFAFLFGSAQSGLLKKTSDIDIGVYLNTPVTPDLILSMVKSVENSVSAECDLTILNTASEILRFEALKGKVHFIRDDKMEEYVHFYSLTCREYEDTMAWMQRQMAYRGYA
jgi:predicted nucleotidyltransferase